MLKYNHLLRFFFLLSNIRKKENERSNNNEKNSGNWVETWVREVRSGMEIRMMNNGQVREREGEKKIKNDWVWT